MALLTENEFGQVHQVKLSQDISTLVINHSKTKAKISLYGGQVLGWQPCGEKEVFWLSKSSAFEQGKAIRGGIPLCWPWFGVSEHQDWPIHGVARTQVWRAEEVNEKDDYIEVSLSLPMLQVNKAYWPHETRLNVIFKLSKTLRIMCIFCI